MCLKVGEKRVRSPSSMGRAGNIGIISRCGECECEGVDVRVAENGVGGIEQLSI